MRVLIIDDSVVFRSQISAALSGFAEIEVAGTAPNGSIALQKLEQISVDLVTLDMEMPDMDGIQVLKEIRKRNLKVKVIVFSSLTTKGATKAIEALEQGADDVIAKPAAGELAGRSPADAIRETLLPKVMQFMPKEEVKKMEVPTPPRSLLGPEPVREKFERQNLMAIKPAALVIGCSTGGPAALENIFARIKPPISIPILIVQHMPPLFTEILAKRITDLCGLECKEGKQGEPIVNGRVYLAPGDYHMEVEKGSLQHTIKLTKEAQRNSVRPAADYLFETASEAYGKNLLGIVLTGMGEDGLVGALAIKKKSGAMVIQDKESCVVFGMPGAIYEYGYYDEIGNLDYIAQVMNRLLHREN